MPTITLMTRTNRSGTFTTPSYTVPTNLTGKWLLRTNMLESDIAQAGLSGSIMIEVSDDGGQTWQPHGGITWISGHVEFPGPVVHNPGFGGLIDSLLGRMIRAQVTLAATTRIGFVIEAGV